MPLVLHGRMPVPEVRNYPYMVFAGPSGAGKTTMIRSIIESGAGVFLPKTSPREIREVEVQGLMPYRYLSYRDFLNLEDPRFETSIVGLGKVFEEWKYWGSRFKIEPPDEEECGAHLHEFLAAFLINDIELVCEIAREEGKPVVVELSNLHASNWKQYFPNTQVIVMEAEPKSLVQRLMDRWGKSVVCRARLLDALSAPKILISESTHLSNDTLREKHKNIDQSIKLAKSRFLPA